MPEPFSSWRDAAAARFLDNLQAAVPLAIEQIDIVLRLIAAARERVDVFLNVGCGDGVLSGAMFDEFPSARGVLLDRSQASIDTVRGQLRSHFERAEFHVADYTLPGWIQKAKLRAPYDAVISGFATRNLTGGRKREFYAEIYSLLKPGGAFLNIDHVASATRLSESMLDDYMIDAVFGAQRASASGQTSTDVARAYYERIPADQPALVPLEVQCDWLREIGFESVDCYLKVLELAVFGGQRPV